MKRGCSSHLPVIIWRQEWKPLTHGKWNRSWKAHCYKESVKYAPLGFDLHAAGGNETKFFDLRECVLKKKKNWIVYESERDRIAASSAWVHKKLRECSKEASLSLLHFLVLGLSGCKGFSGDKGLETQRSAEKGSAFIWASDRARSVGKQHSGRKRGAYPLYFKCFNRAFSVHMESLNSCPDFTQT